MPEPKFLNKGEDSRKNWVQINAVIDRLRLMETEVRRLSAAVEELRIDPKRRRAGGCGRWS